MSAWSRLAIVYSIIGAIGWAQPAAPAPNPYFTIRVIDEQNGRGVPLVELRTVNNATWWTDSAGIVAFNEPGLMGLEVYFHLMSPGYAYPKDGFGNRGVKLLVVPGK